MPPNPPRNLAPSSLVLSPSVSLPWRRHWGKPFWLYRWKFILDLRNQVWHPLITLDRIEKFDVECNVIGGGTTGIDYKIQRLSQLLSGVLIFHVIQQQKSGSYTLHSQKCLYHSLVVIQIVWQFTVQHWLDVSTSRTISRIKLVYYYTIANVVVWLATLLYIPW